MNVTVEDIAACRKKLSVEVPLEDVDREWRGTLAEFQKSAQIPGFRAGHAPTAIIERRFEKEIQEEVQRKLIPQSFREVVAKEKLDVVSFPDIGEVKFSRKEPLRYHATVDVAPAFPLPEYKGLKVKKKKVEIKDEDMENSLKLVAEQEARFEEVKDRPVILGDYAVISYTSACAGKSLKEVSPSAGPLAENKNFWLLIAKDSFLPGFCDALVGARIGEKRQALVDFPKDFRIKDLAGRKATYFVEVGGIREKKLPELNDAFAKSHGSENIAALRDKVRHNLQHSKEHEVEDDVRNQIIDQLLKAAPFEVPESLLEGETRHVVSDIVQTNHMRGVEAEVLKSKSKEIFDNASKTAKERVRTSFLLNRIAKAEKVEVKDEDLRETIQEMAKHSGKTAPALEKQMREQGEWESLRERLAASRTLDLLVSHATVETE